MLHRLAALLLAIIALCPAPAAADGKVFARLEQTIAIPDQEAMIVFDPIKGEQTLLIETRFIGRGTDFAWVVPLPAGLDGGPPQIFAATPGTFPTLRTLFAPSVESFGSSGALVFGYVAAVVLLAIVIPRRAPFLHVLLYVFVVLFFGAVLFLPALAKSRGMALGLDDDPVQVLDRQIVGSFETATIQSRDAAALSTWLTDNGYAIGPDAQPVIADYVRRGWLFVASRIRRDADSAATLTPHPIGFRFSTPRAVYPLALTAVGNGNLVVDLYIFGPGTASAPGFELVRSQPVHLLRKSAPVPAMTDALLIGHPRIVELASAAPHVTRLHAELTPLQMQSDAVIAFTSPTTTGVWFYSYPAAVNLALTVSMGLLAGAWFVVLVLLALGRGSRRRARRRIAWSIPVAIVVGGIVLAALPKTTDYSAQSFAPWRVAHMLREPYPLYLPETEQGVRLAESARPGTRAAETELRRVLERELQNHGMPQAIARMGTLDAPGYAVIRRAGDAIEYVYYDQFGSEQVHRIPLGKQVAPIP